MRIQVKDFISAPVITATAEDSVAEIRAMMKEKGINAIPVISYANDSLKVDITIRGIVTSTDINKELPENTTVEEVMTSTNVRIAHADSSAMAAAKMMLKSKVHHVVVMDDGEIIGMLSSLDFVKLIAEHALE
jgi:CBS domain-containing protein